MLVRMFLKLVMMPPIPAWRSIEAQYEIYPATTFTSFERYAQMHLEWIKLLGLKRRHFGFVNTTSSYNEAAEVHWSEKIQAERIAIETKAREIRDVSGPLLKSWITFETLFGYTYAANSHGLYKQKRLYWLQAMGMSSVDVSLASLQQKWRSIPRVQKILVLTKARAERERVRKDFLVHELACPRATKSKNSGPTTFLEVADTAYDQEINIQIK